MPALGITLAIDASTYNGSVAVLRERQVVATRDAEMRGRDEERLMPAVAACLEEAGVATADLARVVCGAGPGSFTSLRIAASIAKGICHASGLPLFAVSAHALMIASESHRLAPGRYVAVLDAMRGESFVAVCELRADGSVAMEHPYSIEKADRLAERSSASGLLAVGGDGTSPHARGVAGMLPKLVATGPVDLATWEPDYGRAPEAQVRWEAAHGRPLAL